MKLATRGSVDGLFGLSSCIIHLCIFFCVNMCHVHIRPYTVCHTGAEKMNVISCHTSSTCCKRRRRRSPVRGAPADLTTAVERGDSSDDSDRQVFG